MHSLALSVDDGVSWQGLGKTVFTGDAFGVIWANQRFVAVGRGNVAIASSLDGQAWSAATRVPMEYALGCAMYSIDPGSHFFVAVGGGNGHSLAWSLDASSWSGLGNDTFSVVSGVVVCSCCCCCSRRPGQRRGRGHWSMGCGGTGRESYRCHFVRRHGVAGPGSGLVCGRAGSWLWWRTFCDWRRGGQRYAGVFDRWNLLFRPGCGDFLRALQRCRIRERTLDRGWGWRPSLARYKRRRSHL